MAAIITSLFTGVEGFEDADKAYIEAQKNKKRVHYKQTTFTKFYKNDINKNGLEENDIELWGRMKQLHTTLANFFPLSFLEIRGTEDKEFDFGIVKVWRKVYTDEEYEYKGTTGWKTYKGQNFVIIEAEIKGTYDLGIQERLLLHQSYIELLESGAKPDMLNWFYEYLVNFLKTRTIKDLLIVLKNKRLPIQNEYKEIVINTLEEVING